MKAFQAVVFLTVVVFHANADLLGTLLGGASSCVNGLPVVGNVLNGGLSNLPIVGGLPVVGTLLSDGGILGDVLGAITGLVQGLVNGLLGEVPLPLVGNCGANAEQCSLLNFNTTCEKPCGSTQVCLYACTSLLKTAQGLTLIPLLDNCVCKDGFYRNKAGLCVALDVCAKATAGISG